MHGSLVAYEALAEDARVRVTYVEDMPEEASTLLLGVSGK